MSTPTVITETGGRVLRLTLNRPEKRNAIDSAMCRAMVEAADAAQEDDAVGAILIAANGHVFCAGMDLDEAATLDRELLSSLHSKLFTLGLRTRKPIVVAVNGAALGGGLGLVAQGHVVVTSTGAVFGLPELRVGLWPLMVFRALENAIGSRRTLELALTGRMFDDDEALAWGLVGSICHPEEVLGRARSLASDIANASPQAIQAGMAFRQLSANKSLEEAETIAMKLRNHLMDTPDFREGLAAFKEKREPRWPSIPH